MGVVDKAVLSEWRGRPVRGIRVMLKMYLLQIWFGLSDKEIEEAIIDSTAMRFSE